MSTEGYKPGEEEVKEAEGRLSPEQKHKSEVRFATFGSDLSYEPFIKKFFPEGVPIISKDDIKQGRSAYHDYGVAGYITEANSDALFIQTPDGEHVYDPEYLVSDVWGNFYLKKDGHPIAHTSWQDYYDIEAVEEAQEKLNTVKDKLSEEEIDELETVVRNGGWHQLPSWYPSEDYEEVFGEYIPRDTFYKLAKDIGFPESGDNESWSAFRLKVLEEYKRTE